MIDLFGNEIREKSNSKLEKRIAFAISLIQSASALANKAGQVIEVCYSGGKDSDVILELTKMAGVPYRAIYKNTTIDRAGTPAHARKNGCEIVMPKQNFIALVEKNGFPNRFRRFCCNILKEYKILDYAILGIRKAESTKRNERYKEPEACRVFSKSQKVKQYYPILYWTDEDVVEFIKERGIQCHPHYYDENGEFMVERRIGCMCCPLQSKQLRIEEFKAHPNMVKLYIRAGQKYFDKKKSTVQYKDVYEWFVRDVFFESQDDFETVFRYGLFNSGVDSKKFLEDYFKITL